MLRTLSGRMAAAMLVLILAISIVFIGLSLFVTRLQFQEVNQSLGRTLAADVVADTPWLMRGHDVNQEAFKNAFDRLMHVNPSIEIYLLSPDGQIMAFSAPPGRVKRDSVDLAPIQAFLNEDQPLPIRGDDPRHAGRSKVFSAAPLLSGDTLQGYLYVVLGGEVHGQRQRRQHSEDDHRDVHGETSAHHHEEHGDHGGGWNLRDECQARAQE